MPREFKPVRFFVMMGVAAFIVCGVTAFLYATRRAWPHSGRTAGVLDWRESGRASAARRKIANGRGVEHDGQDVFQAVGIGQSVRLEFGIRTRLLRTGSKDSSPAVSRRDRQDACVTLLNEAVGEV